jgi:hypothetical protein
MREIEKMAGWRILEHHEVIAKGDKYSNHNGHQDMVDGSIGMTVAYAKGYFTFGSEWNWFRREEKKSEIVI